MFGAKVVVWLGLGLALAYGSSWYVNTRQNVGGHAPFVRQFDDDRAEEAHGEIATQHFTRQGVYVGAAFAWGVLGLLFFWGDIRGLFEDDGPRRPPLMGQRRGRPPFAYLLLLTGAAFTNVGCVRPFEPIHLETIGTNEEGFLIPLRSDGKQQGQTSTEDYLKQHLVFSKQVQIKQQWVQKGYETAGANGVWQDAEVLIKVDKSPVTREWTADPNSGTSNKNEAIWVMTADQVEFSTGWTITARIASRDDAVKFLHNYPNGSLEKVLDSEVRGKLQATFGLEVTDLPMEELRKAATPHITHVVKEVTTFFNQRGITITNLGITGGFVYKDQTILDTMVKVFNAEQEKTLAAASTAAQEEKNKKIRMEAEGKATAVLTEKKAEAEGIKLVADAKAYEIEKAKEQGDTYVNLKKLDLEREKLKVWDGHFPNWYFSGGNQSPDVLLNIPAFSPSNPEKPLHRTGAVPPDHLVNPNK